jgi:hypothetical protein
MVSAVRSRAKCAARAEVRQCTKLCMCVFIVIQKVATYWPRNRGLIPGGRGSALLSFTNRSDPLWGPPSFLLDTGGSSLGRWSSQVAYPTTRQSTADVKNSSRCTSTLSLLLCRRCMTHYFIGPGFSAAFRGFRHFLRTNAVITADSRHVELLPRPRHFIVHYRPTDTNCEHNK